MVDETKKASETIPIVLHCELWIVFADIFILLLMPAVLFQMLKCQIELQTCNTKNDPMFNVAYIMG